jgi:hypothetical protein
MFVRQVPWCAAAAWLLAFAALSPVASYAPCAAAPRLGAVLRGQCGRPRRVRQGGAGATMGLFGFGIGSGGGDKDCDRENWLRVLGLQAQLQAAVEQERYQGAARLYGEIHQLLAQETDALVRRLSAAAADAQRNKKMIRRRDDANVEKFQLDLDTAVAEEDFVMAAQLRDEIRALEPPKAFDTPDHARRSVSEMEMTYLLDDLLPRSISEIRFISEMEDLHLLNDLEVNLTKGGSKVNFPINYCKHIGALLPQTRDVRAPGPVVRVLGTKFSQNLTQGGSTVNFRTASTKDTNMFNFFLPGPARQVTRDARDAGE